LRRLLGHAVDIWRLDAVDHRVEVVVRRPKTPQHAAERITLGRVRFGPPRCQLDPRNGIVATANTNALASVDFWPRLTVARGSALTCAHGASTVADVE
jgi:hypothetical protein